MSHTFFISITLHVVTLHSYTRIFSTMVNRRVSSPTIEDTSNTGDADVVAKMHVVMDELQRNNQMNDDVHNIKQRQQESNPLEEMELLDP